MNFNGIIIMKVKLFICLVADRRYFTIRLSKKDAFIKIGFTVWKRELEKC